ncbi:unnamed protein product [Sphenostylis stenocarpa]|uniref:Uncharacterized protein n=1 Tax=Sphenostylis stenocarpa TaxID=92480 RepID=A0AA86SPS0_9FABA|nr:unnamed protein product [Sphenostylis stenocarpa]
MNIYGRRRMKRLVRRRDSSEKGGGQSQEICKGALIVKFCFGVGQQIRVEKITERFENRVVRSFVKNNLKGRLLVEHQRGYAIDDEDVVLNASTQNFEGREEAVSKGLYRVVCDPPIVPPDASEMLQFEKQ